MNTIPLFSPDSTLILVALEAELPKALLPDWQIIYMGVGKINAAICATEMIAKYQPRTLINFGTAGALQDNLNGLYEVSTFKQRDMDATPLGFALGETPFDNIATITNKRQGLACGTGDNFASHKPELQTDLVDMEAYALAKLCQLHAIDFYCFKYVSDRADAHASDDWQANLRKGGQVFAAKLVS